MIVKYTKEEYENAKSEDKLALQCEHCGKIFYCEKKQIKFELNHNRGRLKFCSVKCSDSAHKKSLELHCEECGKDITVRPCVYQASVTKHFFCSKSCAAKYNNRLREKPKEHPLKIKKNKKRANKVISRTRKEYVCLVCGKKYHFNDSGSTRMFCSRECLNEYRANRKKYLSKETIERLRKAGRHSAKVQEETRRSKNEKYFCELCEKHFNDVKHNEQMFNGWDADVIIEDIKVAVLWNGKWHYQKIHEHHSLEQVQNRDKIKIKEIEKCGYTPYIIKDMGKYKPQFVEEEFEKFINIVG
jgi:YHS domain-containing protein